jgi:phospholipase C
MVQKSIKKAAGAALSAILALQPALSFAQETKQKQKSVVEIAPPSNAEVAKHTIQPEAEPFLAHAAKLALAQKNIKYVFVLFQENRSFDHMFGTYPGANGLYTQLPEHTPGFTQTMYNVDGTSTTITPFKIPATIKDVNGNTVDIYPADIDSMDHSHSGIDKKLDYTGGVVKNDKYTIDEEKISFTGNTLVAPPTQARKQYGELVMSHIDCDTIPFLWNYANKFTLLDNFFDTVIGPSTPNAIAMISGQSGVTQWVKHPSLGSDQTTTNAALPITGDPDPYWGSAAAPGQPEPGYGAATTGLNTNPASNLTFATLPLTFMGNDIVNTTSTDAAPATDLPDVQDDITKIAKVEGSPISWGWYQQGYDIEGAGTGAENPANNYIAHHNGPQYFGYVSNNPAVTSHLHGLGTFFSDIKAGNLSSTGGVYYVRGGYGNIDGLTPVDPNPALATVFNGNDDHPGYSDSQISEALIADEVNAIANSKYWPNSAIIITYDETDGFYDHTQPVIRSFDPEGNPLDQGPRIPTIVISPFGVVHAVDHEKTEHAGIIKFIDELFNLVPLGDLPDELGARNLAKNTACGVGAPSYCGQKYLGPLDSSDNYAFGQVSDLLPAFDNARLMGNADPLEPSYVTIDPSVVTSLPHYGGNGCSQLGIHPTDFGKPNPVPQDFNPRPGAQPGIPYLRTGSWQ